MTEKRAERRGLGRGLSALMADVNTPEPAESGASPARPDRMIPVEDIEPNPDQPRRDFTTSQLEELAQSIREQGIIQPLILRHRADAVGRYQIVAGERRWRAAQMAQLHQVPALIREYSDTEVLEIAIVENIQRADLNPIEEASAYRQLMDRFGHTQEKMAEALGKSRSHIANLLRLLSLPEDVQKMLREGALTAGHARALVTADNPSELALKVVARGLSVRETEKLAKAQSDPPARPVKAKREKDSDTRALESDLSAALGMKLQIDHKASGGGGVVTIGYTSLDELDELCQILSSGRR